MSSHSRYRLVFLTSFFTVSDSFGALLKEWHFENHIGTLVLTRKQCSAADLEERKF